MGMSGDYLHAIENGSNMIRVGSAFLNENFIYCYCFFYF